MSPSEPSEAQFLVHSNLSVPLLVILLLLPWRMATSVPTAPVPPQAVQLPQTGGPAPQQVKAAIASAGPSAPATALVPVAPAELEVQSGISADSPAMRLRVELEVGVPVGEFRVRNLLALEAGVLVESKWSHSEDVPLAAGRVQLAWTEFEVLETQLAARLTRLA